LYQYKKFNLKSKKLIYFVGLFDGSDSIEKEIIKCIDLAKDWIHAILVVFSVRTRFSEEEQIILSVLQTLFGQKIVDYMIIVFTGGDELEYNGETLDDYIGQGCPQPLKVSYNYHKFIYLILFILIILDNSCYYTYCKKLKK